MFVVIQNMPEPTFVHRFKMLSMKSVVFIVIVLSYCCVIVSSLPQVIRIGAIFTGKIKK